MRLLICGSRDWTDEVLVQRILSMLWMDNPRGEEFVVIEGGARGADAAAAAWCARERTPAAGHEQYPADWARHSRGAGPIRNAQMLEHGRPDAVWAFVTKPLQESRGTADMVQRARAAGVRVYVVSVA